MLRGDSFALLRLSIKENTTYINIIIFSFLTKRLEIINANLSTPRAIIQQQTRPNWSDPDFNHSQSRPINQDLRMRAATKRFRAKSKLAPIRTYWYYTANPSVSRANSVLHRVNIVRTQSA